MARFDATYFPHPPGVLYGLKVTRLSSSGQRDLLATADTITVRATYLDFFFHPDYVHRVVVERRKGPIPSRGPKMSAQNSSQLPTHRRQPQEGGGRPMRVGEIVANNATLVSARADGKKPLEFGIHSPGLAPVASHEPMGYRLAMTNALPGNS